MLSPLDAKPKAGLLGLAPWQSHNEAADNPLRAGACTASARTTWPIDPGLQTAAAAAAAAAAKPVS